MKLGLRHYLQTVYHEEKVHWNADKGLNQAVMSQSNYLFPRNDRYIYLFIINLTIS